MPQTSEFTKRDSSVVLLLLAGIVTITTLYLVIIGVREQRAAIANLSLSQQINLETQLNEVIAEIRTNVSATMDQLRDEVETYLIDSNTTRACTVTFGCPEFESGLIVDAAIYSRGGRRVGAEASSLGDQMLTPAESADYAKLAANLSGNNSVQWAAARPDKKSRPYCWLSRQRETICIAVNLQALSNQILSVTPVARNNADDVTYTLNRRASETSVNKIANSAAGSISISRLMPPPFEYSEIQATQLHALSPTPYWLYSGIFALVVLASVSGFASAAFFAHKKSIDEVGSRLMNMASTSHNLRTPLTNLKLYANLLTRKKSEPELIEKYATIIDQETGRLNAVIDNVLELGRNNASDPTIFRKEIPNELVHQIVATFDAQRPEFRFQLNTESPIQFDAEGFKQVLVNLIDNSLKHAADCPTEISTWLDLGKLHLRVSDISAQFHLPRPPISIEPYRRGENATGKGYGLGLAACQLITERNGGDVTFESTPTAFSVIATLRYEPVSTAA